MGAIVFLVIFIGGWIVLGRYWWHRSSHRVLSVLGAGVLCFLAAAFAGAAADGALSSTPAATSSPVASAPAVAPRASAVPVKASPAVSAPVAPAMGKATPIADETAAPNVYAKRDALEKRALAGDYQAQRNLAYSLGHDEPTNGMQACAWRLVILGSGAKQVDDSDLMNKRFDCNRDLAADALYVATTRAAAIGEKIDARRE